MHFVDILLYIHVHQGYDLGGNKSFWNCHKQEGEELCRSIHPHSQGLVTSKWLDMQHILERICDH